MSRYVVDPSFAATLRELRRHRGVSLRDLAKAGYSSKSQVHQLETGGRRPTPEQASHLDDALGAEGALTRLIHRADDGAAPPGPPHPSVLGDDDDAGRARAITQYLVALDTLQGSDGLVPVAVRAFRGFADRLAVAGGSADARSAVADLGAAAAWIAADATQRDLSRLLALESLAFADLADDVRLHRFLLGHLSMVSEHAGRYGDALAYADRLSGENADNPRIGAMTEVRRARALSGLGSGAEALRAWDRAAHLLTASPSADDGLTYWIHDAEMALHRGIILSRAGHRTALDWVHRGVELLPAGQGRDQTLWRAMLLEEAVTAQAWSQIPAVVDDLMRFAGHHGSARTPESLGRAWTKAAGQRTPRGVADAIRAAADAWHRP